MSSPNSNRPLLETAFVACRTPPRGLRSALLIRVPAALLASVCGCALPGVAAERLVNVTASKETTPVESTRDAADDPALWIHPTDVTQSTVIGTDKKAALEVYRITDGVRIHRLPVPTGNVDLRYNFPLSGRYSTGQSHTTVALVCAFKKRGTAEEAPGTLGVWKVNPYSNPAGALENVEVSTGVQAGPGGTSMYVSPVTNKFYVFQNGGGKLVQSELIESTDEPGRVTARMVRTIPFATGTTESVGADDGLGYVYASDEERHMVHRFDAEPGGSTKGVTVGTDVLQSDTEGITIYYAGKNDGYLIISNQGSNNYAVFRRQPPAGGGPNEFLGKFAVVDGEVDGTSSTDGIDVSNFPVGRAGDFPQGLFLVQDGRNPGATQNFKLVPWERIAKPLELKIDTMWDPRRVGIRAAAVP